MAKDFAVQSYKKEGASNRTSLIIGLITVMVVASFYFLKIRKTQHQEANSSPNDQITKIIKQDIEQPNVEQPRFEFYTMLSESENTNNVNNNKNIKHGKFILRIAEFKYKAEAVKLQKRLGAKNYSTNIGKIEINNNKYYVVNMGPYPNNIEAKQIKLALEKDRYKSTIQKLPE